MYSTPKKKAGQDHGQRSPPGRESESARTTSTRHAKQQQLHNNDPGQAQRATPKDQQQEIAGYPGSVTMGLRPIPHPTSGKIT